MVHDCCRISLPLLKRPVASTAQPLPPHAMVGDWQPMMSKLPQMYLLLRRMVVPMLVIAEKVFRGDTHGRRCSLCMGVDTFLAFMFAVEMRPH